MECFTRHIQNHSVARTAFEKLSLIYSYSKTKQLYHFFSIWCCIRNKTFRLYRTNHHQPFLRIAQLLIIDVTDNTPFSASRVLPAATVTVVAEPSHSQLVHHPVLVLQLAYIIPEAIAGLLRVRPIQIHVRPPGVLAVLEVS